MLVFDKLMRYPISWFDNPEHSTGELTTSLAEDSQAVSNVSGMSQGQCIQLYACLSAGLIVTLVYSWQVGLTAIACVPLILGSNTIQAKFASRDPSNDSLISPATLLERSFANIVVLQAVSQSFDLLLVLSLSIMDSSSISGKMTFQKSFQVEKASRFQWSCLWFVSTCSVSNVCCGVLVGYPVAAERKAWIH